MRWVTWSWLLILVTNSAPAAKPARVSLFIDRPWTETEIARNYTGAKFEPKVGAYLGAFIDLDMTNKLTFRDQTNRVRRLPEGFEMRAGEHATYFFYLGYAHRIPVDWIRALGARGKIIQIALEPNEGLDQVQEDAIMYRLADQFAQTGTKIFLRFASEMNGPWVKYHGDAKKYREKWRLLHKVMAERAPNVAMVWVPYARPTNPIPDYYPGDDAVDWVGVNMYSVTYFNQDKKTPAYSIHPTELLDYVYKRYAAKKPIMIAEFGATHYSSLEGISQTNFARRSIQGLYDALPRLYPRVKAVYYFNTNNLELSHRLNNNYAITQNEEVLETYRDVTREPYFLRTYAAGLDLAKRVPSPLVDGARIGGIAKISGFGKFQRPGVKLRFAIDGKTVHTSSDRMDWSFPLDTIDYKPGPHVIGLEVTSNGKRLAWTSVKVVFVGGAGQSSR